MNLNDAIRTMQEHNAWRRGQREEQPTSARAIGEAIDMLIVGAQRQSELLEIVKQGLDPDDLEIQVWGGACCGDVPEEYGITLGNFSLTNLTRETLETLRDKITQCL